MGRCLHEREVSAILRDATSGSSGHLLGRGRYAAQEHWAAGFALCFLLCFLLSFLGSASVYEQTYDQESGRLRNQECQRHEVAEADRAEARDFVTIVHFSVYFGVASSGGLRVGCAIRASRTEEFMSSIGLRTISLLVILTWLLGACAQTGETVRNNPKTTMGGMLGAASGGLIAAAAGGGAAGIVGGVLLGGLVGGAVGNALDQKDKQMAQQAAQQAFENARTGESSAWLNPDSGNSGSITPTRTYQAPSGQYCREYQQDILVGGEPQKSYGTACRQPDGSWQVQG